MYPTREMGDHFVLLVNRLITDSTIEAVIESENRLQQARNIEISPSEIHMEVIPSAGKLMQCRICHDEDEDFNMESPCSCCGSLKYAHRKCVQRWCSEKGDTICEICRQQFEPNYIAPTPLLHYGGISMNFRRNWEIPMRDLHNSRFIARVDSDNEFSDTEFEASSPRGLICCRVVAIIVHNLYLSLKKTPFLSRSEYVIVYLNIPSLQFMVLLVLRHTLPVLLVGAGEYSMTVFMLLMLRTIGILLPIYVMVKAVSAVQRRSRQTVSPLTIAESDEENDLAPPSRFIHVH